MTPVSVGCVLSGGITTMEHVPAYRTISTQLLPHTVVLSMILICVSLSSFCSQFVYALTAQLPTCQLISMSYTCSLFMCQVCAGVVNTTDSRTSL